MGMVNHPGVLFITVNHISPSQPQKRKYDKQLQTPYSQHTNKTLTATLHRPLFAPPQYKHPHCTSMSTVHNIKHYNPIHQRECPHPHSITLPPKSPPPDFSSTPTINPNPSERYLPWTTITQQNQVYEGPDLQPQPGVAKLLCHPITFIQQQQSSREVPSHPKNTK